jgi:MFS transporter, Spinster family, sphingosine-1-phosphate transporter
MSDVTLPTTSESAGPSAAKRASRAAAYVFWIMFLINFLNYFDRFIFLGLEKSIQDTLHLSDFELGTAVGVFLLVYTLVALPLGFMADRIARKTVVAVGVAVWSVASFATGFAASALSLLGIRAFLGIGEGSYYPAGTPLLAAHFPPARRPVILGRWTVGALVGAAVGFLVAGFFTGGQAWRNAFFFTGVPGLVLAFLLWRTAEKQRHEDDPPAEHLENEGRSAWTRMRAYLRIPTIRTIIGVQALGFFASTGATTFFVIYLADTYEKGSPHFKQSGVSAGLVPVLAGAIVLLGGIFGSLFGGPYARWLSRKHTGARVLAGGLGYLFAAPAVIVAVGAPYALYAIPSYPGLGESSRLIIELAIFSVAGLIGASCLNFYQGPTTTASLDVVPAAERAGAGGTVLGLSHLLGDVYAASLIGFIGDRLAVALGGSQIGLAMLITMPIALVGSGIIGIRGSKHYAKDVAALGSSADVLLGTHSAS